MKISLKYENSLIKKFSILIGDCFKNLNQVFMDENLNETQSAWKVLIFFMSSLFNLE